MTKKKILELFLGIVVLGVSGYFAVSCLKYKRIQRQRFSFFQAEFDAVDGLNEGACVKISGVTVGHVKTITLDQKNFSAVASFSLQDNVKLPLDTVVSVISESLFGGKILSIIPGCDPESLPPGSTIHSTQSSVNIESLLQKFLFGGGETEKTEKNPEKKEEEKDFSEEQSLE